MGWFDQQNNQKGSDVNRDPQGESAKGDSREDYRSYHINNHRQRHKSEQRFGGSQTYAGPEAENSDRRFEEEDERSYRHPVSSWEEYGDYGQRQYRSFDQGPPEETGPGQNRSQNRNSSRNNEASFAGLGPKGYQRSDERIREDVCEHLCEHPRIDASPIEVEVRDQVVILKGHVHDRKTKRLAEEVAERVSGVHDVRNELAIQPSL